MGLDPTYHVSRYKRSKNGGCANGRGGPLPFAIITTYPHGAAPCDTVAMKPLRRPRNAQAVHTPGGRGGRAFGQTNAAQAPEPEGKAVRAGAVLARRRRRALHALSMVLIALAAPAAAAPWTRSFVVTLYEPAFHYGGPAGTPGSDCPGGTVPDNDYRRLLHTSWRSDAEIARLTAPSPR